MNKIQQLKELMSLLKTDDEVQTANDGFYEIGKSYAIRGVTLIYTGKVLCLQTDGIILENAAWIADTGRFNEFVSGYSPSEREPYKNPIKVYFQVISDATKINDINEPQSVL